MCDISQSRIKKACREWVNCVIARAHHHNFFSACMRAASSSSDLDIAGKGEKGGIFLSCERERKRRYQRKLSSSHHSHTTHISEIREWMGERCALRVLWSDTAEQEKRVTSLKHSMWNSYAFRSLDLHHTHIFFRTRIMTWTRRDGISTKREQDWIETFPMSRGACWLISTDSTLTRNLDSLSISYLSAASYCSICDDMDICERTDTAAYPWGGREEWAALRDDEFSSPHHVHTGAFRVVCERERERTHIRQPKRYQQAYYQFNIIPLKFEVWFPFKAERKLFKFSFS